MDPRLQLILGFDMMRAAYRGGHDLRTAWKETLDTSTRSAQPLPHVWGGGLAFLLTAVRELEERGVITQDLVDQSLSDILKVSHAQRLKAVYAATQKSDLRGTFEIVYAMLAVVEQHRDDLSFSGQFTR